MAYTQRGSLGKPFRVVQEKEALCRFCHQLVPASKLAYHARKKHPTEYRAIQQYVVNNDIIVEVPAFVVPRHEIPSI